MRTFDPHQLAAAYCIDLVAGDPAGMPHPVRLMGLIIALGERIARPGKAPVLDFITGAVLSTFTASAAWLGGWLIVRNPSRSSRLGTIAEIALAWTTLATGSLLSEAEVVIRALEADRIEEGRDALARIVGRDTASLSESDMARAVIETVAEGLCDGVAAPLFYLTLGGLPLSLGYKALNTLDSMIGHLEPPHTYFGRFAACADDIANFVPARLTALAIIVAAGFAGRAHHSWCTWVKDGHRHPSPNAGQSEAAMAGALNVQLGGLSFYQGVPSPKPLLGQGGHLPTPQHARQALTLARIGSFLLFVVAFSWCSWKRSR